MCFFGQDCGCRKVSLQKALNVVGGTLSGVLEKPTDRSCFILKPPASLNLCWISDIRKSRHRKADEDERQDAVAGSNINDAPPLLQLRRHE